ncbi:MAG: 30S ribosomal protein S8 [Candidatus Magasanikbacteria bacterium]|nr:30S ribosomal protein S8 [Candidatus Magasanikbacteria bacterium]
MMMTDPIADMLTRIRNAQMVHKSFVEIPFSNLKKNIAEILSREGYLDSVEVLGESRKIIKIGLKYKDKKPYISDLQRVSKPGHRVYKKSDEIPYILNGYGTAVISTSFGLMTDKEARSKKVGGEVICSVY